MEKYKKINYFLCLLSLTVVIFLCLPSRGISHSNNSTLSFSSLIQETTLSQVGSKEKHFSLSKKQKIVNDTLPQKPGADTLILKPGSGDSGTVNEIKKPDTSAIPLPDTLPYKLAGNALDTVVKYDTVPQKPGMDTLILKPGPGDSGIVSEMKKPDTSGIPMPDTLSYKLAGNALDTVVKYYAKDSMVLNNQKKTATLYGEANSFYKDKEINAPIITFDQDKGEISAALTRDSLGKVIAMPTIKEGDLTSQSDSLRFNMKTGKGLTKSTYTQQGEMYIHGKVIKKINDDTFYAFKGSFTTCNLDTPHFAFVFNKIEFITNKMAISGPVHPEVEGVPIPIYLPFGIFPLAQGRHSGILSPNFTTNEQRGVGLEGLGYYKVLNEHWDVILRTSIYSYGGWSMNINPRYSKRYHYNGNMSLDIQHFNFNFKGDPGFQKNRSFNIRWSHNADTKARPGVNFSANVNAGSSSYNAYKPNAPFLNVSNQLTSSISYSKTWKDKPFNLSITANHNQNTNNNQINVSLPSIGFNVNTIYPFRKKDFAGKPKWYENIGIGYTLNAEDRVTFYDTVKNKTIWQQIADTLQWGARHTIPISLSLPPLGAFNISPSVSYEETWFQKRSTHYYNQTKDTLFLKVKNGFYTMRQMSFGLSASTRLFGMLTSTKKNARIIAIRQEIRPSFGISYRPDMNKDAYYFTTDSNGRKRQYSYYESQYNLFGPYSSGEFGGINFGIDNNISMKTRNRKDTGEAAIKKVAILDALSIRGSYNFLADSLNFSPLSVNASTNLFNKLNITAYASFNLYQVNDSGQAINQLIWKNKPLSLGRLQSGGVSISSQFQGGKKSQGKKSQVKGYDPNSPYNEDQYNAESDYIQGHPGDFADFNIPWSVNFSYAMTVSNRFFLNEGFKTDLRHSANFGGSINLTPKWQIGVQGSYNISQGTLMPLSLSISRDLHCWQMSINIVPVGLYRYFSINLSPKSPLLRDLKVNKTEQFRQL